MNVKLFIQSFNALLPTGLAFPRATDSVVQKTIRAMAQLYSDLHEYIANVIEDWFPHATQCNLEDWERATGLPNRCITLGESFEQRREIVLFMLYGVWDLIAGTEYQTDSIGYIKAFAAKFGHPIAIKKNKPFRVSTNKVGDALGSNGILHITPVTPTGCATFKAGNQVENPLYDCESNKTLECILQQIIPARYTFFLSSR